MKKKIKEVSDSRWWFVIGAVFYGWIFSDLGFLDSLFVGGGFYVFLRSLDYFEAREYTGAIYLLILSVVIVFVARLP